jgi:F0F1-type ATP synthase membrane subunit c/vacuolar-type H+-ATPase subunit K
MAKKLRRNRGVRVVVLAHRRARRLHKCLQVSSCIQAVSRKLRVSYMVAGHVTRLGRKRYHVDLRVIRKDGDVMSSKSFRTRTGKGSYGGRVALGLIRKARQVRVAAASTTATDAPTNAPLFSRSEAESASRIVEVRDTENPLTPPTPPEKKPEPKVAGLDSPASPDNPAALPPAEAAPEAAVQKENRISTNIFSKRYMHAWATFGAGVAALGSGVAFGVISKKSNDAAHEAVYQKEALVNHDKAKKNALVANILYGVGGAAVLTSALMFYLEHRKEVSEKRREHDLSIDLQVAEGGGGLTVKGSF